MIRGNYYVHEVIADSPAEHRLAEQGYIRNSWRQVRGVKIAEMRRPRQQGDRRLSGSNETGVRFNGVFDASLCGERERLTSRRDCVIGIDGEPIEED